MSQLSRRLADKAISRPTAKLALTTVEQFPFLKGIDAHYKKMNEREYAMALKILK
jgi:hypothetical protein